MPYEIAFTQRVPIRDRAQYINDCCVGGDVVIDQLLPLVDGRYERVQTNQEDWGWFVWFRKGSVRLAIDVFTDDPELGVFRVHLTSRIRRWVLFDSVIDTPELDELRELVQSALTSWVGHSSTVTRLDGDYTPVALLLPPPPA